MEAFVTAFSNGPTIADLKQDMSSMDSGLLWCKPMLSRLACDVLVGSRILDETTQIDGAGQGKQQCISVPLESASVWRCKLATVCPARMQAGWDLGGSIPVATLSQAGVLQTWTVWTDEEGGGRFTLPGSNIQPC